METVSFTSPDCIKVNGVSSASVGLWIDTPPVPPMASQRITTARGGLDCDISTRDDVWDDITLKFDAYAFFTGTDFDLSPVYAWLANAQTLEMSRLPGFSFKVRSVKPVTPSHQYDGERVRLNLQFVCRPFKYFTDNEYIPFDGETITNPGTRFCRPVYHITGTQTVTLTVNGTSFTITGANGTDLYIDSERMLCYKMADNVATNILPKTSGQFPFLQPGTNNVSISAGTMTVKLNARCY